MSFAFNQENPSKLRHGRDPLSNTIENDKLFKKYIERKKAGDGVENDKPLWESILEDIEKNEANPIPVSVFAKVHHYFSLYMFMIKASCIVLQ